MRGSKVISLLQPTARLLPWWQLSGGGVLALAIVASAHRLPELTPDHLIDHIRLALPLLAISVGGALDDSTRPATDATPLGYGKRQSVRLACAMSVATLWWWALLLVASTHPGTPRRLPWISLSLEYVALLMVSVVAAALGTRRHHVRGISFSTAAVGTLSFVAVAVWSPQMLPSYALSPTSTDRIIWLGASHLGYLVVLAVALLGLASWGLRDPKRTVLSAEEKPVSRSVSDPVAPSLTRTRGAMQYQSIVELRELSQQYGRVRALNRVSLDFGPGITGLLGPNGAGKSSMLRLMATLEPPASGQVLVDGRGLEHYARLREVRRHLGYMPQEPGFHGEFTVAEFLDYVAILKELGRRDARAAACERVLVATGLANRADVPIRKLSGGMRQRVALAQALLGDPKVLLLDEPTAGLDPEQRLRFREIVSEVGERRLVVVSTHQTEDVSALCQRVVVLVDGGVRFAGSTSALAATARGKVWSAAVRQEARVGWRTRDGSYRHLGRPPPEAELVEPTIEDAYLLLVSEAAEGCGRVGVGGPSETEQ